MTPNKNRSRKYWVLMSIQFSDIYMLRKYIYIIHIYIHTWLYAYTYGSCSKSYTTSECLKIFGFSVIYVTVYVYSFKMIHFFIHQQKLQLMDFGLIFGPGTASVSSYPLFKWCSVCFGKMMWTLVCVSRDMCVCVNLSTQHMYDMYMIYIYICVCNLTDQEDLLDDDAHLSKDVDMHFPFQEGKDYGRRSSTFRWCERKDLKLSSPNSYSGSPSETHQIKWFHLDMVNLKLSQLWYSKHRKWWCKDFGKKGPAKTPWCLTQCVS